MRTAITTLAVLLALSSARAADRKPAPATKPPDAKHADEVDKNLKKMIEFLDRRLEGAKFDAHRDPALELQQLLLSLEKIYSRPDDGLRLKFDVDTRAFAAEGLEDPLKVQVGGKIKDAIEGVSLSTYLRKVLAVIPVPSGATFVLRREPGISVAVPGFPEAARLAEPAQYVVVITTRNYADGIGVFSLKKAHAADVAKVLQEVLQRSAGKEVRCSSDEATNSVIVRGSRSQLDNAAGLIGRLDEQADSAEPRIEWHIFALKNARTPELAKTLQTLFHEKDPSAIRFVADERTNSIIARGRPDQIQPLQAILTRLDEAVEKKGEQKTP